MPGDAEWQREAAGEVEADEDRDGGCGEGEVLGDEPPGASGDVEHHAPTDPRDASEQPRRLSWPRMRTELGRLRQVRLHGDAGSALACTELTSQQQRILGALNIPTPPPVTALDPT